MGRKAGFPKKGKWDELPTGFKEAIEQSSTDEIRKRVSDIALLDCKEHGLLKADPEVGMQKEKLKNLMEPYRENFKSYKLQISFCNEILKDKGGGTPTTESKTKA